MIWQKLKIKQLIAVLLVLSFVLPFANFAKAFTPPVLDPTYQPTPQAPTEVYPGGAPPSDTGGGIWSWLGSSAACLGGLGIGAGSAGAGTAATVAGCAGLAGKITKFLGGDAGGWLSKGLGMGLDAIAKSVRKNILSKLYQKMLAYISGEGGQVLDWGDMATDSADEAAGLLLDQIAKATIDSNIDLCNPWDDFGPATNETTAFFKLILGKQAPEKQWSCKASEIKKAGKKFFENFEGGWDAWLEVTTKPMANPYGQYLWAIENKNALIDKLTKEKTDQAISGGGYLGQEKIMQWHIIAEASETNKGGVVSLDSCPLNCTLGKSAYGSYCDCYPDGVGFKDLENYYGLRKDDNNRLTAGTTMPEICKETLGCYLVVDRKELFTPGMIFANAASNILLKDVRAAETGDTAILEYYTAKIFDDIFNALITRGIRGLGDHLAKDSDATQQSDGFSITSRREQIGALEEESAFSALKSTYAETLLAFQNILEKKDELRALLESTLIDKNLYDDSKDFYYCAMNKCAEQEYNDCGRLHIEDYDPDCAYDVCDRGCIALIGRDVCRGQCMLHPPKECIISSDSQGAKCLNEGWDFCANPKLPGPEYDNPQVQNAYKFYTEIISYKYPNQFFETADKVNYGGFVDDCTTEEFAFNSDCQAKIDLKNDPGNTAYNNCVKNLYTQCFDAKLNGGSYEGKTGRQAFAGLFNIEQFITWDKVIIQEFEKLDAQGKNGIAERDNAIWYIKDTTPGDTTEFANINQYYKSYYEKPVYEEEVRTTEFWRDDILRKDQAEKDKYYKNGLDGYDYLIFKKKQLRQFYSQKYIVPDTACEDGCDIEELANALSGKKQSRALKMDSWNKSAYKTQWETKSAELEQEKRKLEPKNEKMKKLVEEAQALYLKTNKTPEEEGRFEEVQKLIEDLGKEMTPVQTKISNLEQELNNIKTASGKLNQDIEDLTAEIAILQDVYDSATEQLVTLIADADNILQASNIDKELEKAKQYLNDDSVETQRKIIKNHKRDLLCGDEAMTVLPQKPIKQK